MKKKILSITLRILIIGAVLFFFARTLIMNWDKVAAYDWKFNYPLLVVSGVIYCFLLFVLAYAWHMIFKILGEKPRAKATIRIYILSLATKFIPGTVWQYLSQIALCKKEGIPRTKTLVSQVIDTGMFIASSLAVVLLSLFFWGSETVDFTYILLMIILTIIILAVLSSPLPKKLLNFGLGMLKVPPVDFNINFYSLLPILILRIVVCILQGITFFMFISSLQDTSMTLLPAMIGIFSIGWLAGYVSFFAPSGIGIREGVFTLLLSNFMPLPIAVAVSILSRVWIMLAEFAAIFIAWSIKPESKGF